MTPQHHSYFNRGIEQMLMKVKCLKHLGEFDRAIDEVSRFLLSESYFFSETQQSLPQASEGRVSISSEQNRVNQEGQHFLCYYLRGKLLGQKGDFKGALINFNNAQLINERDPRVMVRRIQCYSE